MAHQVTASGALFLCGLIQIFVSLWVWRIGPGPAWPVAIGVALWCLESLQIGAGYTRALWFTCRSGLHGSRSESPYVPLLEPGQKGCEMRQISEPPWGLQIVVLVSATAALNACSGPNLTGAASDNAPPRGAIEVRARDNRFQPEVLDTRGDTRATIYVLNEGDSPHDFTFDDAHASTGIISPGDSATLRITVPETGARFHCSLHAGMEGRLQVKSL